MGFSRLVIKLSLCFLNIELLQVQFINKCRGMFSEQLKVCSTSTEIVKVLLLTFILLLIVSCFTCSCYSSRREVSRAPVSHL